MRKITATFLVDEDRLVSAYKDCEINNLHDALNAEVGVMEENGVKLLDWKIEN